MPRSRPKPTIRKSDDATPEDMAPPYTRQQLEKMDAGFVRAVLDAIAAGSEHCFLTRPTAPGVRRP